MLVGNPMGERRGARNIPFRSLVRRIKNTKIGE